jgi:hypothetical protein
MSKSSPNPPVRGASYTRPSLAGLLARLVLKDRHQRSSVAGLIQRLWILLGWGWLTWLSAQQW